MLAARLARSVVVAYAAAMIERSAKRARGRPRDPAKRAALLAAARALFLERGTAVTMDQVVARAGVSRATLYANFGDKGELLAAVIAGEAERFVKPERARNELDRPVEELLIRFGGQLVSLIAEAETMAFERLIAQAALDEPGYGAGFFAAGPGRTRGILARIIDAGRERGELDVGDLEQAANDLIGLWQGLWRTELQYGHRSAMSPAELDGIVHHGVRQFLALYARRDR